MIRPLAHLWLVRCRVYGKLAEFQNLVIVKVMPHHGGQPKLASAAAHIPKLHTQMNC